MSSSRGRRPDEGGEPSIGGPKTRSESLEQNAPKVKKCGALIWGLANLVSYSRIGFEPCSARPTFLLPAAPAPALALGLVERIELSRYTAGCRCIAAITQQVDERLLQAKRQARTRENVFSRSHSA